MSFTTALLQLGLNSHEITTYKCLFEAAVCQKLFVVSDLLARAQVVYGSWKR